MSFQTSEIPSLEAPCKLIWICDLFSCFWGEVGEVLETAVFGVGAGYPADDRVVRGDVSFVGDISVKWVGGAILYASEDCVREEEEERGEAHHGLWLNTGTTEEER
jgi:hypothetical protein